MKLSGFRVFVNNMHGTLTLFFYFSKAVNSISNPRFLSLLLVMLLLKSWFYCSYIPYVSYILDLLVIFIHFLTKKNHEFKIYHILNDIFLLKYWYSDTLKNIFIYYWDDNILNLSWSTQVENIQIKSWFFFKRFNYQLTQY